MIFKTDEDRAVAYKNTFSSNEGRMVLVDILGALGFWDTKTPENLSAAVEQNVLNLHAKKILMRAAGEEFGTIVTNMLLPPTPKKRWWDKPFPELFGRKRK